MSEIFVFKSKKAIKNQSKDTEKCTETE